MNEEMDSIDNKNDWDLIDVPVVKASIGVKWVYKTKFNEKGKVERHKSRLVAKGFSQQPNVDYGVTFTPIERLDIVRPVLAVASQNGWPIYHMGVKSPVLNGILEEEVYIN